MTYWLGFFSRFSYRKHQNAKKKSVAGFAIIMYDYGTIIVALVIQTPIYICQHELSS